METFDPITSHPARMNAEPCIRILRFTVCRVLEALAADHARAQRWRQVPALEDQNLRQPLPFPAALILDNVLPQPRA